MISHYIPARRRSAGYSMIEVLVSLSVIAIAMLGAASLQFNSLKMSKGASLRTQAVLLSTEITERMESNKTAAIAGSYAVPLSSVPAAAGTNCLVAACTAAELASYDIAQWGSRIARTLPGSSWQITQTTTGNPVRYTIVVNWQDRRDKTVYANAGNIENFAYTATRVVFE